MRDWTPEARARQSELVRSWKPWEHSTGPTSEVGKARSATNAHKHGARSAAWKNERGDLLALLGEMGDNIMIKGQDMADAAEAAPRKARKAAVPAQLTPIRPMPDWQTVQEAARAERRLVSRVFHPAPVEELVHLRDGINAGVAVGEPGYQLSSGEIISL